MKNDKYWQKRFKQLEKAQHKKGMDAYQQIEKQYREAERTLEGQISAWYQRFADNNDITLAEARSYLKGADLKEFKWDVNDYIRYGEENAVDGKWMKELENASAKYHISKLDALKIETQNSLEDMYTKQLDTVTTTMQSVYESEYYHTAYEVQKGLGVGWDFAGLNQSEIEKVISKPWAVDGVNFSDRIWDNKEKLISTLHNELTQNIMLGQDPQKAIDAVAKAMNTSKNNAGRLVMTEEAYFSSAAQGDCYRDLGVEEFEIVATLDSHTSEICQEMDGQHFPMKDYQAGVTAPPFHPWCRSTTVPYFEDDYGQVGERAARGDDGKTYNVPADMTYKEWEKTFVEGDKSVLQEIENNAKIDPESIKLTDEEIDSRITELKKQQEELSGWGDYDQVVKDFGSVDAYFQTDSDKNSFMELQTEIEQLQSQRTVQLIKINGKLPGEMMSVEKALNANPNFTSSHGYQVNCQRCVQTYEMRRRGYDVKAKPKPTKNNIILWGNECFVDSSGQRPEFIMHQTEAEIKTALKKAPDKSRHIIYVKWSSGRSAHVFIAEKENGVTRYVDPQPNDPNVESYFRKGQNGHYGILRVDDKKITTDETILNATME